MTNAKGLLFLVALLATLLTSLDAEAARRTRTAALKLSAQPSSTSAYEGSSVSFSMTASAGSTITYTWYKNGTVIGTNSKTLTLSNISTSNAGAYSCKVATRTASLNCANFTLTVNQIVRITGQPASATLKAGGAASLSVAATGTAPLSYQWYFNGNALSGATTSSLNLSNLTSSQAGSYHAVVTNPGSSATSSTATVAVTQALALNSQPSSISLYEGGSTTFSLGATSSKTLTYTWYKDGVVTGSNSSSLTISNATTTSAGTYSCQVSDGTTTISCTPFSLTVNQIVRITSQPANQALNAGASTALSVTATGTAPLSYQWYFNGSALSGATSSTLNFSSLATADSGSYYCVVTNPGSRATSSSALLSIAANAAGKAQISWSIPATREDGTPLDAGEIASFELYYAAGSSTGLSKLTSVSASETSIVVDELAAGTHYFAIATTDSAGLQSSLSPTFSVTIN